MIFNAKIRYASFLRVVVVGVCLMTVCVGCRQGRYKTVQSRKSLGGSTLPDEKGGVNRGNWTSLPGGRVGSTLPGRNWSTLPGRNWSTLPGRNWSTLPGRNWSTLPGRMGTTLPGRFNAWPPRGSTLPRRSGTTLPRR